MSVVFKNRFPQIIAELGPRVDAAMNTGAHIVATKARVRVPDAPPHGVGLVGAIHVERQDGDWAVVAGDADHWYGHLVEHGTTHSAPHPFLVPALEESRDDVAALAAAALRKL